MSHAPTPQATVMVVEDDPVIRALIIKLLDAEGHRVIGCCDGRELGAQLKRTSPDVIVLDVMMPGEDGLSICRRLSADSNAAILIVSAKGDEIDRVLGLEIGADDYLAKPFSPRELAARVKALVRRQRREEPKEELGFAYAFAGWCLNTESRTLLGPDGEPVRLTGAEYALLLIFVERPNRVLSREKILDLTSGRSYDPFDRAIDVQLSRLRKKLNEDARDAGLIRTVRGGGYILTASVTRTKATLAPD